jgi:hypothetical protein
MACGARFSLEFGVIIPACIIALIYHDPQTGVKFDRASQQLNTPQLRSGSISALTMTLKATRQGGSQSRAATSDRERSCICIPCDSVAEAGVGLDAGSDAYECVHVAAARSPQPTISER